MHAKAEATFAINECLHGLYHGGVFIPSGQAKHLAQRGLRFLTLYRSLAVKSFHLKKQRFPFVPKGHYLHHQMLDLLRESQTCEFALNLLAYGCQMQEDFVGRPSRVARRTNPRSAPQRVIQRIFLLVRNALQTESGEKRRDEK